MVEQVQRSGLSPVNPDEESFPMSSDRTAVLYRMILPDHTCPYGVRAKELLEQAGFDVDDRILRNREEVEDFKADQGVATTPQVFIDGERIGGSTELEQYLVENRAL
jgi:glutaredoxin